LTLTLRSVKQINMVFKRPNSSRDDKSNQSSGRRSGGADSSKRTSSASSRPRSTGPSSDRSDSKRAPKSYSNDKPSEKRSYTSWGSKPYAGKSDGEHKSSFTGGEKKPFSPRNKPYTGRPSDNDSSSGEKRPYSSSRSKPYSGRVSSADSSERPKRSPDSYRGSSDSGDKKPYSSSRPKSYSGRPTSDEERPKRSFSSDSGDKKPYSSARPKSYSGRPAADEDRPKRSPDNYRGTGNNSGEKKFGATGSKPRERSGERKSDGKLTAGDSDSYRDKRRPVDGDKPFRKTDKSSYDKITPDRDAPVKTLRGRKEKEPKDTGLIRLNRYIANAGICSRRKADELIEAGVVSVNGEVVNELGHKIDPMKDEIRYNGELLKREKMVYVLLNKPKDYITTTEDPQERRTVMHLVEKASRERIYPIGRLDRNTTGLLLMTNDGDLADKLSHPRSNITKLYQVELSKPLAQGDMNKIQYGLELEDGLIKPDSIAYVQGGTKREIGIQIHSGKNRIVRRIFEHLGYDVVKLDRVIYAGLTKKDLTRGRWRYLDEKEIIMLKHLIQ